MKMEISIREITNKNKLTEVEDSKKVYNHIKQCLNQQTESVDKILISFKGIEDFNTYFITNLLYPLLADYTFAELTHRVQFIDIEDLQLADLVKDAITIVKRKHDVIK